MDWISTLLAPLDHFHYWWREAKNPESVAFDAEWGTNTASFGWVTNYEPTRPSVVHEVLDAAGVDAGYTFVDVGCGKGRTLLLAAQRPFDRVVGVDNSATLCRIAEANARLAADRLVAPIEVRCEDARRLTVPDGPRLVFLYNPFGAEVMGHVLLRTLGADTLLAYVNPLHDDLVQAAGFQQVAAGREGEVQHWRLYAPGRPRPTLVRS